MSQSVNILEQLTAYLDGELSAEDARVVESAVSSDATVARELERLRAARELVRRLPREQAPEGFTLRVMAQAERVALLEQPGPPVHPAGRWRRMAAMAAVVLLVLSAGLVVGVAIYSNVGSHDPARRVATGHPASQPNAVVSYGQPQTPDAYGPLAKLGTSGDSARNKGSDHEMFVAAESPHEKEWPAEFSDLKDLATTAPFEHWTNEPLAGTGGMGRASGSRGGGQPGVRGAMLHEDDLAIKVANANPTGGRNTADAAADALFEDVVVSGDAITGAVAVGPAKPSGDALVMLISTDNVEQTRKQVEGVLFNNKVTRMNAVPLDVPSQPPTVSQAAANHMEYDKTLYERAVTGQSPVDVVIVQAYVTPERADALAKELDELRQKQLTPQRSVEEARSRNARYIARANETREVAPARQPVATSVPAVLANVGGESRTKGPAPQGPPPPAPPMAMDESNVAPTPPRDENDPSRTDEARNRLSGGGGAGPLPIPTTVLRRADKRPPASMPTATPVSQPTEERLQRVLVTVEYRALPRTTTGQGNK